ncbi:S-layer homology domain-containing protein [Geosporobacter ferrireducens]|uniref:S-layer homology domain-containing protein n=1 Tax=Geosporobacter ferrireducens TaxID=1424294 RepID=UPI00139B4AF7|nr:S-layer homology domain-containing protein [Geosporobacter ferrireducens]MTI53308.1 S-layer homology domain-containing protein [Geosporobacter ferrireducens]
MNRKTRMCTFFIVTVFLLSTVAGNAASIFSDINSVPWATEYINKMADKEIIKGSIDEKTLQVLFKPSDPVTYIEALQMIYKTLEATNQLSTGSTISSTNQKTLQDANIPSWAHTAVGYALSNQIVTAQEVKNFVKNGKAANARRVDVAIFAGKALNMDEDLDPLPILSFQDAEMIIKAGTPYVDLLARKGIITGDAQNKFNPNNSITRAEMAVICSKVYDLLFKQDNLAPVVVQPPKTETQQPANQKTMIADYVNNDGTMLVVKDEKTNVEVYTLDASVTVKKDGSIKRAVDIRVGDVLKLTMDNNNKLTLIEIDNTSVGFEGFVDRVIKMDDYYLLVVKDKYDAAYKKEYTIDEDTDILRDKKAISANRLVEGEQVSIVAIGQKATKITVEASRVVYDGILESNQYYKIKVMINNDQSMEFEIDDKAYIRRDNKKVDIIDLAVGDIVTVTVEYNKAIDVRAISRSTKSKDEGSIKTITLGNPTKITIVSKDDKEEYTYEVSNSATIRMDREDIKIYDLRPGYTVELQMENKIVTRIDAKKTGDKNVIIGEITRVYKDLDRLRVEFTDGSTGRTESVFVEITDDTTILSSAGTSMRLSQLVSGDEVLIEGYYEDDWFVARRIIQLD